MVHVIIHDEAISKVSMEFETEEEAYNFYNTYAYNVGFSIRMSKGLKDKDGKMRDRTFCCSCEGSRGNDKRNVNVNSIVQKQGKYQVLEFIAEHNHVTSSPIKSHLHRSQRRLIVAQAAEIEMAEASGIAPKSSLELMARRASGRENLGFILDDCLNYIHTKRTIQMRARDTDAKMMEAYSNFGDVVCFDTTYRKNHDLAMLGKKPRTILTDQSAAMPKALEFRWPETYHRLCIWHMYQNAAKHLSSVFQKFLQFAPDFGDCIYEYEEEDEFINARNKMLERYDLKDNVWLHQQFKLKEKQALVYDRDVFCANMTTTQ
ncbi:protein FAR1-RELATED SEQUENCE 5-like [Humulus lupulus]|uniref:protein FAR1-RELATED SEQUENCE 5-like n=1 Tax=Humulus lupulus TaxID=3486 RepID=UPI002B406D5A|nr:protein FAR1-RELATED SEQUENCE 5-like [Humulus lupulus]